MKRSFVTRIVYVYRLFDVDFAQPFGPFYRSRTEAVRAMYNFVKRGQDVVLQRYREFSGAFRMFDSFVTPR